MEDSLKELEDELLAWPSCHPSKLDLHHDWRPAVPPIYRIMYVRLGLTFNTYWLPTGQSTRWSSSIKPEVLPTSATLTRRSTKSPSTTILFSLALFMGIASSVLRAHEYAWNAMNTYRKKELTSRIYQRPRNHQILDSFHPQRPRLSANWAWGSRIIQFPADMFPNRDGYEISTFHRTTSTECR